MKIISKLASLCVLAINLGFLAPVVHAVVFPQGESSSFDLMNVVRVSGVGKVLAKPDVAVFTVGVETQGETSQKAQSYNNTQTQQVIDTLKKLSIKDDDIKTQWYNISPNYDYQSEGGRKLIGYTANHSLNVKIRNLDNVSAILDSVTGSGATNVENVQYIMENTEATHDQARVKAAKDAKAKALKLAKVFGFDLGPLVQVEELVNGFMPIQQGAMSAGMGGGQSVIQPGDVEIQLTLNATFSITSGFDESEVDATETVSVIEETKMLIEKKQADVKNVSTQESESKQESTATEQNVTETEAILPVESTKEEDAAVQVEISADDGTDTLESEIEDVTITEIESAAETETETEAVFSTESTDTSAAAESAEDIVQEEVIIEPVEVHEPETTDPQAPVETLVQSETSSEIPNFSEELAETLDEIVKVTALKNVMPLELDLLWFDGEEELEVPALGFEQVGELGSHQIKVQFQNVVSYLQAKGFKTNPDNTAQISATEDMRGYEKIPLICSVEKIDDVEARTTSLTVSCGQK